MYEVSNYRLKNGRNLEKGLLYSSRDSSNTLTSCKLENSLNKKTRQKFTFIDNNIQSLIYFLSNINIDFSHRLRKLSSNFLKFSARI